MAQRTPNTMENSATVALIVSLLNMVITSSLSLYTLSKFASQEKLKANYQRDLKTREVQFAIESETYKGLFSNLLTFYDATVFWGLTERPDKDQLSRAFVLQNKLFTIIEDNSIFYPEAIYELCLVVKEKIKDVYNAGEYLDVNANNFDKSRKASEALKTSIGVTRKKIRGQLFPD